MTEYPGFEIDRFESKGAVYCCGTDCIACSPVKGELNDEAANDQTRAESSRLPEHSGE